MMPREELAMSRGAKIDEVFESIGSGMVASRVRYEGPLSITDRVRRSMDTVDAAVLERKDHNPRKASRDRMAAAIATAMSKLIELSTREGIPVGKRIADKA